MPTETPGTRRRVPPPPLVVRTFAGWTRDGKGQLELTTREGGATLRTRRHEGLGWDDVELIETTSE